MADSFVSFFDSPFYDQDEDLLTLTGEEEETEEEKRIRELQELLELEQGKERLALEKKEAEEEELIKQVAPQEESTAGFVSFLILLNI